MVWFLVVIILLLVARDGSLDAGVWLRFAIYGGLSLVCPALVIPVGVCWIVGSLGWDLFKHSRSRYRERKRIRSLKPPTPPSALTLCLARAVLWIFKERGFGGRGWLDGLIVYSCLLGAVCVVAAACNL